MKNLVFHFPQKRVAKGQTSQKQIVVSSILTKRQRNDFSYLCPKDLKW
jgi:hypothetical protein